MLTFISIAVPLIVAVVVAILADKNDLKNYLGRPNRITAPEICLYAVVVTVVSVFVTMVIGPSLARNSAINGYKEFYNGSITQARVVPDKCEKDGSCSHTYVCDTEYIYHPAEYDSEGHLTRAAYTEVIDHHCPYATYELDYVLDDSLGRTITIGDDYFQPNPQPWRGGHGIPSDVPRTIPTRWLSAKQHLEAGMSDPVTGIFKYANFILASDGDLYKKYSGNISKYKKAGLLPKHTVNLGKNALYDYETRATKVQTAGNLKLGNLSEWNNQLMLFNAALGSELRGDLHIVLVPSDKVGDSKDYITALKAYWTSLGKWSISKNGIILALGISADGKTVQWVRADTGMPYGNNAMISGLESFQNFPADPVTLLGNITASVATIGGKPEVTYNHGSQGLAGKIIFSDYPYKRPCMKCEDAGETGVGYTNLKDAVPVSTGSKILMFIIVLFLSLVFMGVLLAYDPLGYVVKPSNNRSNRSTDPYDKF